MSLSWTLYPSPHGAATGLGDTVSETTGDGFQNTSYIPPNGKEGTNVIEHILSITHGS